MRFSFSRGTLGQIASFAFLAAPAIEAQTGVAQLQGLVSSPPLTQPAPAGGPLAYWRFDETAGTIVHDSAGQFPGALSTTGAEFVPGGVSNQALSLHLDSNGYATMGNVFNLWNDDFSLGAWVKVAAGELTPNLMIVGKHLSGYDDGYFLAINRSGIIGENNKALFFAGSTATALVSSTSVNDGNWHHLVGVYTMGGVQTLYVDGKSEATAISRPIPSNSVPFLVGGMNYPLPSGQFTGLIDEVQIYNYSLTGNEVAFLHEQSGQVVKRSVLEILPDGGLFTNQVSISFSTTLRDAEIRYTLDATAPTTSSPLYSSPIHLTAAAVLQARAFVNNFPVSEIVSAAFQRVYAVNDGIPLFWRQQFFGPGFLTDPRVAAEADPDADGASNSQEFLAGTDPLDPLSGFAVQIRAIPLISWKSISNNTYRIFRKESFVVNWAAVADIRATGSITSYLDLAVTNPSAFYGLTVLPLQP